MRIHSLLINFLAVLVFCTPVFAQTESSNDELVDEMVSQMLRTNFLTPACQLPSFQPKVAELRRTWSPDQEELITRFLGSREAIMDEQRLDIHQIWGRGTRFKSGTVIYLFDRDSSSPQSMGAGTKEMEVVPSYLDVYHSGYEYANNISHTAVYATDVKKISKTEADVTYYNVYEPDEGQEAAERLLTDMHGEMSLADDFRIKKLSLIQDFSERLYVYQANPEFLTEFNLYGEIDLTKPLEERQPISRQQVALPVWDVYAKVMLDGDKLLTSMAYYWDNNLKVDGTPKESIHSGTAMLYASEYIFEAFNSAPPLLTVQNVTMGFIQDPDSTSRLIPVWFFDAWYTETMTVDEADVDSLPALTSAYAKNILNVPFPFAVNALTGEVHILDKSQI